MRRLAATSAVPLLVVAALAGCGERAQISQTSSRKPDVAPWQGADNAFGEGNWKRGEQASWEQQLRTRSLGQNEYSRASKP